MHGVNKLGLGTVQFGLDYGISNEHGRPTSDEVVRILAVASRAGITLLDTAHGYGDSESVLGSCLPSDHAFRIVTKTASLGGGPMISGGMVRVRDAFRRSLERLRQPSVYGLLVHHADDLLGPGGKELMDALLDLKAQRLMQKVGVSVYDQDSLDALLARFPIDIVQVPINLLDQRLLQNGTLARLRLAGIEVHARSVFLQGLLLMAPDRLGVHFRSVQGMLRRFHAFARDRGKTPLEISLRFVLDLDEIDCAVVGVTRHEELDEIVSACRGNVALEDYSNFAVHDESILNPSRWSQ